jgi:hypothetical protein
MLRINSQVRRRLLVAGVLPASKWRRNGVTSGNPAEAAPNTLATRVSTRTRDSAEKKIKGPPTRADGAADVDAGGRGVGGGLLLADARDQGTLDQRRKTVKGERWNVSGCARRSGRRTHPAWRRVASHCRTHTRRVWATRKAVWARAESSNHG